MPRLEATRAEFNANKILTASAHQSLEWSHDHCCHRVFCALQPQSCLLIVAFMFHPPTVQSLPQHQYPPHDATNHKRAAGLGRPFQGSHPCPHPPFQPLGLPQCFPNHFPAELHTKSSPPLQFKHASVYPPLWVSFQ